jgi:quinolinate synthase
MSNGCDDMKKLAEDIRQLSQERKAVILAHVYQRDEVQAIAHYTGDSLALSRIAVDIDADVIVLCGVWFMAETAEILNPDKIVLLPERDAGCPLADMATVTALRAKKEAYPEAAVVSYVNSSAAIKAESDICCTSSNAVKIVNSLTEEQVIFVPDRNLGRYVAGKTNKQIILWPGFCPVHNYKITAENLRRVKAAHPDARIMVHPECTPEVIALADFVGSTAQMLEYTANSSANEYVVGTERGLLYELTQENPDKTFYSPSEDIICEDMKKITLAKVARALQTMRYEVQVPEDIRVKAKRALDRMLEVKE